jgi:sugar porter (SP) family MFS transporter
MERAIVEKRSGKPVAGPAQGARYAYSVSIAAALGGLLFGYDIAVINGALVFLRKQLGLTDLQTEIAATGLLVGCVFGAGAAGALSDRFGRKKILLWSAVLFVVSSIGAALPRTLLEFTFARFLGGVAIGMESMLAPLYTAEIAPARIRGRLVSLNQFAIVTGILTAYTASWLLAALGEESWRWMFASATFPSAIFLWCFIRVPESPRWLIKRGRTEEARQILGRVGGEGDVDAQVREIAQAIAEEEAGTFAQLFSPGLRRPIVIAVVLAILQQITGINTILFYGSVIFTEQVASQSEFSALWANVVIGSVNFICTIIALAVIDRAGRKPLLLVASGGMALCHLVLGLLLLRQPGSAALILAVILLCVAFFAVGLGPGVWVLMSELFPTRVRGRAMSVATISLWIASSILTFTFLSLVNALTASGAFWIYGAMALVTFVFVWRATPETKGKTLEEIERWWKHPDTPR